MKKSILVVLVLFLMASVVAPQARAFELGSAFSSFTDSIKQKMQRVYLALPGNKSGQAVVEQSVMAMEQVKTIKNDAQIKAVMLKDDQDVLTFDLAMVGPVKVTDAYDPATYQQDLKVTGSLTVEGTTMAADADLKLDGETVYVKFNQIPVMPFLPAGDLKDKWLKMDSSTPDAVEAESATVTDEQKQQLQELNADFVKSIQFSEARRETVDGVKAFVVEATIPPESIKNYVKKAAEVEGRPAAEIEEMMTNVDKGLALMSEIKATFVIDRSTFYMTKVELPLQFDLTKVDKGTAAEMNAQVLPLGDAADADTLKVTVMLKFSDFNQPIEFTVPTDARDAAEVFAEVMGAAMGVGTPGAGVGTGAVTLPPAALQNSRRPVELPELSPEEEAMLRQYGIDPDTL